MSAIKRKVQLTGRGTYIVSLPKDWAERANLEAGQEVEVLERSDGLLIRTKEKLDMLPKREITLTVTDKEKKDEIIKKVIALYLHGYDLITVNSKDSPLPSEHRQLIKETVLRKFTGSAIIDESSKHIVIQNLVHHSQLPCSKALNRMYLISRAMFEDVIEAFRKFDKKMAEDVISRDDEVDKFDFFVTRQVTLSIRNRYDPRCQIVGATGVEDCPRIRFVSKCIEKIADYAVEMGISILQMDHRCPDPLSRRIIQFGEEAQAVYTQTAKAFFNRDQKMAFQVLEILPSLTQYEMEAIKFLQDLDLNAKKEFNTKTGLNVWSIIYAIKAILKHCLMIVEVAIDLTTNYKKA